VHEVFLKVHARLADYDDARPFVRPWRFGFAYRVAADHRRLARHRVELLGARREGAAETLPPTSTSRSLGQRELVLCVLDTIEIADARCS
jgi:DNA-directed RNA polymerase specialized sigma24 family protein